MILIIRSDRLAVPDASRTTFISTSSRKDILHKVNVNERELHDNQEDHGRK